MTARTNAQRVERRRDKMRHVGLRPAHVGVPDASAAGFAAIIPLAGRDREQPRKLKR